MNFYQKHQVSPPKRRLFSSTSFCCHGLWYTTPLCCLGPWIHLPPNVWHSFKVWIDPCRMLSSRVFLKVTLGSFFPTLLIFKGFHKQHPNFASSIRLQCQSSWVRLISFESCHLWTAKRVFVLGKARFHHRHHPLGRCRVPILLVGMNPSEETIYLFVWEASTNFGWFRSGGEPATYWRDTYELFFDPQNQDPRNLRRVFTHFPTWHGHVAREPVAQESRPKLNDKTTWI